MIRFIILSIFLCASTMYCQAQKVRIIYEGHEFQPRITGFTENMLKTSSGNLAYDKIKSISFKYYEPEYTRLYQSLTDHGVPMMFSYYYRNTMINVPEEFKEQHHADILMRYRRYKNMNTGGWILKLGGLSMLGAGILIDNRSDNAFGSDQANFLISTGVLSYLVSIPITLSSGSRLLKHWR